MEKVDQNLLCFLYDGSRQNESVWIVSFNALLSEYGTL